MPRADKSVKVRKTIICKLGKQEKEALEALSHPPKFPEKMVRSKTSK